MTENEIKGLLLSNELSELEVAITKSCNTYINDEHIDFTIGVVRREIDNSGLTIEFIRSQLVSKKDLLIEIGIRIVNALKDKPIVEDYPEGERISKNQKTKVVSSHGMGIGFGIKYAIYVHFLENNPKGLIEYIKKERIPKAKMFNKVLIDLYKS